VFLGLACEVRRDHEGRGANRAAKRLFTYSLFYLFALFLVLLIERALGIAPLPALTDLLP
jgi:protoheme IX farnesyltransferase